MLPRRADFTPTRADDHQTTGAFNEVNAITVRYDLTLTCSSHLRCANLRSTSTVKALNDQVVSTLPVAARAAMMTLTRRTAALLRLNQGEPPAVSCC